MELSILDDEHNSKTITLQDGDKDSPLYVFAGCDGDTASILFEDYNGMNATYSLDNSNGFLHLGITMENPGKLIRALEFIISTLKENM